MHVPVHDRMPTPVGTHLIRAAALVCHVGRAFIRLVSISLEPGPSRARYFPRDMLLLTTTAREGSRTR